MVAVTEAVFKHVRGYLVVDAGLMEVEGGKSLYTLRSGQRSQGGRKFLRRAVPWVLGCGRQRTPQRCL